MYEVDGYINGVLYTARVGGEPLGDGLTYGLLSGSPNIVTLMFTNDDEIVGIAPGPTYRVGPQDPLALYAGLKTYTDIINTRGDVPVDPEIEHAPGALH